MARNAKQQPAVNESAPAKKVATANSTARSTETPPRIGAQGQRQQGHGHRLTAAFEALERFPALAGRREGALVIKAVHRFSP